MQKQQSSAMNFQALPTPKKQKFVKNILIKVSEEYSKQYGFVKTAVTGKKKHQCIGTNQILNDEQQVSTYSSHQKGKEDCKDKNNIKDSDDLLDCQHQQMDDQMKQDEQRGFDDSQFYPFISIDPNQVHSHSVGTYIDLDHKSTVKSEPMWLLEESNSQQFFDQDSQFVCKSSCL